MFEQSVITHQKHPWTLAASLTLQTAAAASVVLLSILSIERLPPIALPVALPPLPSFRAVEIVRAETAGSAAGSIKLSAHRPVFTAPTKVPAGIPQINDAGLAGPSLDIALSGTDNGAPAGIPYTGMQAHAGPQLAPPPPPPQVQPKPPSAIRVGGQVLEAKMVHRVLPAYPLLARNMRIAGKVQLLGTIGRDGAVRGLKVLGGHPMLVQAAVEAVRQWLYSPTLLNGQPVEVIAPIEVNFTLTQ